ncbi:hypothetical protein ACS0TY_034310 [Phlomoides rotata]
MYLLSQSLQWLRSLLLVLVEEFLMHSGVLCPLNLYNPLFVLKTGFVQNPLL